MQARRTPVLQRPGDHLGYIRQPPFGSTSITTATNGAVVSSTRGIPHHPCGCPPSSGRHPHNTANRGYASNTTSSSVSTTVHAASRLPASPEVAQHLKAPSQQQPTTLPPAQRDDAPRTPLPQMTTPTMEPPQRHVPIKTQLTTPTYDGSMDPRPWLSCIQ
jgi:hypothetical protein